MMVSGMVSVELMERRVVLVWVFQSMGQVAVEATRCRVILVSLHSRIYVHNLVRYFPYHLALSSLFDGGSGWNADLACGGKLGFS